MEQPFVWPALPEDPKPWGLGQVKSEIAKAAEANGIVTMEQKREKARSLREQVKALLTKKEPLIEKTIAQKRREGRELTPEELEKEEAAQRKKTEIERMSVLKFWEEKRPAKAVQSDDSSRFSIKA